MSGMYENWMHQLVRALRLQESEANLVVVDWLAFAQQVYPDAVNHTVTVGQSIAALLDWLQVSLSVRSLGVCWKGVFMWGAQNPPMWLHFCWTCQNGCVGNE